MIAREVGIMEKSILLLLKRGSNRGLELKIIFIQSFDVLTTWLPMQLVVDVC